MESQHDRSEGSKPKGGDETAELVDLEEQAKTGKPAPPAKQYAFRVDRQRVVVDNPEISGADILAKVNKTPQEYKLYKHVKGNQPVQIDPNQIVDLREPGLERFTTMPRDTTEGREGGPCIRQDFLLPEADGAYLNDLGLPWETVLDGQTRWLKIHEWVLPAGYDRPTVSVALLIPAGYSDSQIDMVYFNPGLSRLDGKAIGALSSQIIVGETWQRWSRHRSAINPWRPGEDDISSHLTLVDDWLRREFEK